jgi:hypothetical protein
LIDASDIVVPESGVQRHQLNISMSASPIPPLKPADPFGRARMRLWTKQLDRAGTNAGIAILSLRTRVPGNRNHPRRG